MSKHGKHELDDKAIAGVAADSPKLRALIIKHAAIVARRANASLTRAQGQTYPDYDVGMYEYRSGMPGAAVFTRSNHAKYSEAKRNTLLRVLGSK